MIPPAEFKRMVLGLPHSSGDYAGVALTAEFANLLGLDLVGIFASDESLIGLAGLPCVREFRLSGGWHPVDARQMERVSIQAAADARRMFGEAVRALRAGARFDLAKGPIGDVIGSQSHADDIIVVIEPRNPAERVTHQFRQLLDTALRAPSATLLIPSRLSRRKGPVVAVATSEHDASLRAALRVAELSHERLLLLTPPDMPEGAFSQMIAAAKVQVERRLLRSREPGISELDSLLAGAGECFVVLTRGVDAAIPPRLAFERAVPVLVTEPA